MSRKRDKNLVALFTEKVNDPNLSKDYTIDDFYNDMDIPKKNRTDFATAAILKQMLERRKKCILTKRLQNLRKK